MGFKSKPVAVGTTNTDIYEMGTGLAGAIVLGIGNQTGDALTYTLKIYKQSTAATTTLVTTRSAAANSFAKLEIPIALEAGDKIIMLASATGIVAFATVTDSASVPVAVGWTPRGDYDSGATYAQNDIVAATDGNSYISMADGNINNDPTSSPTYWMVNALRGVAGAMTGPGSSVDGEIALYNGTAGTALKRASITGILKAAAGVLAAAVAGTDYLAPAAIGATVQAFDAQLFSNIPQNSKSAAYTLVATDAQKHILHPSADTTARVFTIPANSSVAFPIGTAVTFVNQNSGGVITISITSDTLRWSPSGSTGSRTLAANGVATALKITATEWMISGTGLT